LKEEVLSPDEILSDDPTSDPTTDPTPSPTNTTMAVVPTSFLLPPAPVPAILVHSPPLDPCGTRNECDSSTTICVNLTSNLESSNGSDVKGFCSLPPQHLSFTFLEGTAGKRCSLSASENNASVHVHSSFETCLDMCELQIGSVARCRFVSFNNITKECVVSPKCDAIERDETGGIAHLFCNFRDTEHRTCAGSILETPGQETPTLGECDAACDVDKRCNYYSYSIRDGWCELYQTCAHLETMDTEPVDLSHSVYMMDGK
jgi:hypothetical protein